MPTNRAPKKNPGKTAAKRRIVAKNKAESEARAKSLPGKAATKRKTEAKARAAKKAPARRASR